MQLDYTKEGNFMLNYRHLRRKLNLTMEERERKKREWEDGKGDNCYIVSCRIVGSK